VGGTDLEDLRVMAEEHDPGQSDAGLAGFGVRKA
jgi:hypothetical protein